VVSDQLRRTGQLVRCHLCQASATFFYSGKYGKYFRCETCHGIFLAPEYFPTALAEKKRYEKHSQDVTNPGYQEFVTPLVQAIIKNQTPQEHGLDFGCGRQSIIQYLLQPAGFELALYDPYFKNNPELLNRKYDFIVCSEVIEHFQNPAKEFKLLHSLLNPGGSLYCLTDIYTEKTDFKNWYYKNDPTHVFFYHPETIKFIQEQFGFADYQLEKRLIRFVTQKT
jgi:hypothetical protein